MVGPAAAAAAATLRCLSCRSLLHCTQYLDVPMSHCISETLPTPQERLDAQRAEAASNPDYDKSFKPTATKEEKQEKRKQILASIGALPVCVVGLQSESRCCFGSSRVPMALLVTVLALPCKLERRAEKEPLQVILLLRRRGPLGGLGRQALPLPGHLHLCGAWAGLSLPLHFHRHPP